MKAEVSNTTIKSLIARCCQNDMEAKRSFQESFGILIYNYPMQNKYFKMGRISPDEAGNFYLYAFEKDRIFKRLKSFEGERISFRNYLQGFVLRDLLREWLRWKNKKKINTCSIADEKIENFAALKCYPATIENQDRQQENHLACKILSKKEFLVLRILYMYEFPLQADDIRQIASLSGKSIAAVLKELGRIHDRLFTKESKHKKQLEKITVLYARRIEYEQELKQLEEKICRAKQNHDYSELKGLVEKKEDIVRKLEWRILQAEKLRAKNQKPIVTVSYKEIASLLNTSTGSIGRKIKDARDTLKRQYHMQSSRVGQGERGILS